MLPRRPLRGTIANSDKIAAPLTLTLSPQVAEREQRLRGTVIQIIETHSNS